MGPDPLTSPPPGWYPAPSGTVRRWWDGHAWTQHVAPIEGTEPLDPPTAPITLPVTRRTPE